MRATVRVGLRARALRDGRGHFTGVEGGGRERSRTRTCAQIATSVAGPAHRTASAGDRPWQTRCAETTFVVASRRRRETMTPNRRTTRMPRLLTAAAGTALALSLSGCGLLGGGDEPAEGPESEAAQPSEGASDAGTDSSDEAGMTQTTPSESTTADPAEAEPTDTASTDLFADAARTKNWASDDAMDVDDEGNGIVPARSIEADLIDWLGKNLRRKVRKAGSAKEDRRRQRMNTSTLPTT